MADPRTLDALPAIDAKFAETFAQREDYRDYLARQCAKLRDAVAAAGPPGALTDADRALTSPGWCSPTRCSRPGIRAAS